MPDSEQGIATPGRAGLGEYYRVTAPNGVTSIVRKTDVGPGARTGRGIDISSAAAEKNFGYSPKNFPTDGKFTYQKVGTPPASPTNMALKPGDGVNQPGLLDPSKLSGTLPPKGGMSDAEWEMRKASALSDAERGQTYKDAVPGSVLDDMRRGRGEDITNQYLSGKGGDEAIENDLRDRGPGGKLDQGRKGFHPETGEAMAGTPISAGQLTARSQQAQKFSHEVTGKAAVDVNVTAPRGTRAKASGDGMFKQVSLNRTMAGEQSTSHAAR